MSELFFHRKPLHADLRLWLRRHELRVGLPGGQRRVRLQVRYLFTSKPVTGLLVNYNRSNLLPVKHILLVNVLVTG